MVTLFQLRPSKSLLATSSSLSIHLPSFPSFGMTLATDKLNQRVYIKSTVAKKSASELSATLPATRKKIQGGFIVEIDGVPVFTKDDATASFSQLRDQGSDSFTITFAPERKLSANSVRIYANEYCLLAPRSCYLVVGRHSHCRYRPNHLQVCPY